MNLAPRHPQPLDERLPGLRLLLTVALLLSLGSVLAEQWTVQTAAFQDHRQARAQADELRALGFDAYTEFAMFEGRQYSRVRLGCFATREGAAVFAGDLRGAVTADAVAQPLTAVGATKICTTVNVGFLKPATWELERMGNDIVFRVMLAGTAAYLHHDGSGWRLRPELLPAPSQPPLSGNRFAQGRIGGVDVVKVRVASGEEVVACSGELLWQSGYVAVVERTGSVIACVVDDNGSS